MSLTLTFVVETTLDSRRQDGECPCAETKKLGGSGIEGEKPNGSKKKGKRLKPDDEEDGEDGDPSADGTQQRWSSITGELNTGFRKYQQLQVEITPTFDSMKNPLPRPDRGAHLRRRSKSPRMYEVLGR